MPRVGGTLEYAEQSGPPWSGYEIRSGRTQPGTARSVLRAAGLSWKVAVGPLYGPNGVEIPDKRSIYRTSDGRVLGIGSPGYQPWQNEEMFDFADPLVREGHMSYVTAGEAQGGRKVWLLARLRRDIKINNEKHEQYLLLFSGHDRETAITGVPTGLRVACFNMVQAALAGGNAVRVSHHPQMSKRLEAARTFLETTIQSMHGMREWLELAATIRVKDDAYDEIEGYLFGELDEDTSSRRANSIELFRSMYDEEAARNGETAYSLFNTITGFADHGKRQKGNEDERRERRFLSITEGRAARWKQRAIVKLEDVYPKLVRPDAYVHVRAQRGGTKFIGA